MDNAIAALVGAALGAVISTVLPAIIGYISYRRRIKRELQVAVLKCQDRLLKIEHVLNEPDKTKMLDSEKEHLGTNLDDYLSSIAALPRSQEYKDHLAIYRKMHPILLADTPDEIRSHLGPLLKLLDEASSTSASP